MHTFLDSRPGVVNTDGDHSRNERPAGEARQPNQCQPARPQPEAAIVAFLWRIQLPLHALGELQHLLIPQLAREPGVEVGLNKALISLVQSGQVGADGAGSICRRGLRIAVGGYLWRGLRLWWLNW